MVDQRRPNIYKIILIIIISLIIFAGITYATFIIEKDYYIKYPKQITNPFVPFLNIN